MSCPVILGLRSTVAHPPTAKIQRIYCWTRGTIIIQNGLKKTFIKFLQQYFSCPTLIVSKTIQNCLTIHEYILKAGQIQHTVVFSYCFTKDNPAWVTFRYLRKVWRHTWRECAYKAPSFMKGERSPLTRSEQSSINEQNMLYKHLVLRTVLRNILRTCLITIRFSAVEKSGFVKKTISFYNYTRGYNLLTWSDKSFKRCKGLFEIRLTDPRKGLLHLKKLTFNIFEYSLISTEKSLKLLFIEKWQKIAILKVIW